MKREAHRRLTTLAGSLNVWTSVALVAVGMGVICLSWFVSDMELHNQLQWRCRRAAAHFALQLRDPVWNLNPAEVKRTAVSHLTSSEIIGLNVTDQFGGELFSWGSTGVKSDAKSITARQPIVHEGELIGYVSVIMSTRMIAELRWMSMLWVGLLTALAVIGAAITVRVLTQRLVSRPLDRLAAALKKIAGGNYELIPPDVRSRELATIWQEVNAMAEQIAKRTGQLEDLRKGLGEQVKKRTQALALSNRKLQEEVKERHQAESRLVEIAAQERQRIGRDLHDNLGQQLAGLAYLASSLAESALKADPAQSEMARKVAELSRESATLVRRLSRGLVGPEMSGDSLLFELQRLSEDAMQLYGVDCSFTQRGDGFNIREAEVGIYIYRIVQEALNNAVRHGQAATVEIELFSTPQHIRLSIADDGLGMPVADARRDGLGLMTMRARAEALGGTLDVHPGVRGGTVVEARLPNPPHLERPV